MSTLLSLHQVNIGYLSKAVLRNVTLDIASGESVAILGSNGSGKTTFLKTIAGIFPVLSGEIRFASPEAGRPVRIGYVPQRMSMDGVLPLTVVEVVEMGTYGSLKPWQGLKAKEQESVDWSLNCVDIENLRHKLYWELSGGQQQRVLIARAMVSHPDLLVLDEPLASLDRDSVRSMVALLGKLKMGTGMTLLWADHFLPALQEVVQEVLLIEGTDLVRYQADDIWGKNEEIMIREENG
jgi:ABC-type Mn2+/Zn2+ transport system ATPase subunit